MLSPFDSGFIESSQLLQTDITPKRGIAMINVVV